jgi:external thioesterase TEII
VVCGTPPPEVRRAEEPLSGLNDEVLLERLIEIGGIPADLAERDELFDRFKHAIRADMKAYETFDIRAPLIGTTLLAFGGSEDEICRPEHLSIWSRYCSDCRVESFGGGHLFLQSHAKEVAQRLAAIVDGAPPAGQQQEGFDA